MSDFSTEFYKALSNGLSIDEVIRNEIDYLKKWAQPSYISPIKIHPIFVFRIMDLRILYFHLVSLFKF